MAILFIGCAAGPLQLGPKPEIYGVAEQSWKGPVIDDFRAWLTNLEPKSAAVLRKTGEVSFNYPELQRQDPTHAALVAKYAQTLDDRQTTRTGLIFRSTPQTITFLRTKDDTSGKFIPGEYVISIRFAEGNNSSLMLSEPLVKGTQ